MGNISKSFQSQGSSIDIDIKPMPFWQSLLYFGLPALLFRIFLNGMPALIRFGISPFQANIVSFTVPAAILFALAFIFYKSEGYPLSWSSIKMRFRLLPIAPEAADGLRILQQGCKARKI